MRTLLIGIGIIVVLFIFAILMAINVKMPSEKILVRIDTQQQYNSIVLGHSPDIKFESLRDTILGKDIKILRVDSHNVFDDVFASTNSHIGKWLQAIGVTYMEIQ